MLEEELYDMDKEEESDEIENENSEAGNIPIASSVKLYLNSINGKKLLTYEKEQELGKRVAMGDSAAKQELVECNLRLDDMQEFRN